MSEPATGANPSAEPSLVRARVQAFLAAHTTLSLASADSEGRPAVAALFYAHDDALNLYYLSEESTQHAHNLGQRPLAAAAVYADGQDWQRIWGLQVRGEVSLVAPPDWAHAAGVYGRKYAFLAALLVGQEGPAALRGPLARARFFVLRPHWLRLIDNSVHFGYKQELWLDGGA